MALQLFRLAGATVSATNANYAYFFTPLTTAITIASGSTYSTSLAGWTIGDGTAPTEFVTATGYNLCINGVMQQSGLYTVTSNKVTLTAPVGGISVPISAPMTLQTLDTTISPTTVAVP